MGWSFRIGRIAGTDVKVHVTFLLLLAWIALSSRADGGTTAAVESVIGLLALFACVLLHEFGHIFAAKRYGIHTPDVILLPIGGVARLSRIPEEPRQEIAIALAGPMVNLVIAAAIFAGLALTGYEPSGWISHPFSAIEGPPLVSLMAVNLLLLVFNLAPAFPMDGGRVLRALIASGAQVMVCGGRDMAAGVAEAITDVLAPIGLTPVALKAQGRYAEDVY